MIILTERLQAIADNIDNDESVADIGTDHGYLPLYLYEHRNAHSNNNLNVQSPKLIMTDVSKGSLKKAEDNMLRLFGGEKVPVEPRLGDGLEIIKPGEVDTIVMAGIGGLLMTEIMDWDISKTMSYKKYILQPRNNGGALRRYLYEVGIEVEKFLIVPEDRRYCEIMVCRTPTFDPGNTFVVRRKDSTEFDDNYFEYPDIMIAQAGKHTKRYLEEKCSFEKKIVDNITAGRNIKMQSEIEEDSAINIRLEKIKRIEYLLSNI